MTTARLDAFFQSFLDFNVYSHADPSINGIQVDNDGAEISKVAFAVDASLETIQRAAEAKAGMLFVHHGLLWAQSLAVRGGHYRRIAALIKNNIALYACHLPLDAHPEVGNNAALADLLNLSDRKPFGLWHGVEIGIAGTLPEPLSLDDVLTKLFAPQEKLLSVLPFGPKKIRTAAIVSGGATEELMQAISIGVDLFVTGDASHTCYHPAKEAGIHMISGGHYETEIHGVKRVAAKLGRETGVDTFFIDIPTKL